MNTAAAYASRLTENTISHELTAAALLREALEGSGSVVIANRTFRAFCAGTTRGRETDFVILHPRKGVVVVELKARNSRVFFSQVEVDDPSRPGHTETLCLAENAMRQVEDAACIVMHELRPYLAALSTERERAFDPKGLRGGDTAALYSIVSAAVAVFPSIPDDVVVPRRGDVAIMGLDALVAFLCEDVDESNPFFYADELDLFEDVLCRNESETSWSPGVRSLKRAAFGDRILSLAVPLPAAALVATTALPPQGRLRALTLAVSAQAQKAMMQPDDAHHALSLALIAQAVASEAYHVALRGGLEHEVCCGVERFLDEIDIVIDESERLERLPLSA